MVGGASASIMESTSSISAERTGTGPLLATAITPGRQHFRSRQHVLLSVLSPRPSRKDLAE
ncbi:hypothetical protein I546_0359 [Mycobacterium kansasii 732]|uniref:Uncharacterized protein n=1 Tax=Mycobacterium kansasii TaxID=1768 RepID=A0A1V3WKY9_MYCKA|nr:hypothetical protein I546_0359 [Mycobacterium kansasii 732]OOK67637.1 hypothetical protein BZL30_7818 [Mycobacterium kansasii]